jgi:tetratricopeptide (TPR) repeat protein
LYNIAECYLYLKDYTQSEQFARQAIALNDNILYKINLAHALLFQNRYEEAELIYRELSQTIINEDNEAYAQAVLEDLEKLEKAGVIPKTCKANLEKIRKILRN